MQLIEQGDDTNIVIDCNISGAPEYVRRYLGRRKVKHLDLLVFSGTDEDHADVDGFQTLINVTGGNIGEIWYPDFPADTDNWKAVLKLVEDLKSNGTIVKQPVAGDEGLFNSFRLKVLSPHPDDSDTSNNASIVLKVSVDDVGFLCPGDCESESRWGNIVRYFKKWLPSNILLAAHHGSINGCSEEAVKVIAPEYTIISCGEDNQHDHPHDEAVEIYTNHTSETIYITHEVGSILFESDGKTITNVVLDAGQSPDGKKMVETLTGRGIRRSPSVAFPEVGGLSYAIKNARPTGEPPKDRVGFGRI
jgi:beta-lactamase superfamily II metal-dependent hydrolase